MISPIHMTMREWADVAGSELERQFRGIIPRLDNENGWREWAQIVVDLAGIAAQDPPRPTAYDTFIDWARAFNNAVSY